MIQRALAVALVAALWTLPAHAQRRDQPFGARPQAAEPQSPFWIPNPSHRRGDRENFHPDGWRRGRWVHGPHDGKTGWWWVIGPNWYYFTSPVYPGPDLFGPPGSAPGWWYWCDLTRDYYPYTTQCPSGWRRILPRR